MSKPIRCLLFALCLVLPGLAAAPAAAQTPPASAFIFPVPLFFQVDAVGAGETEADALDNALDALRETYLVLRYEVTNSVCAPLELPGQPDSTLCGVQVHAWVLRKAFILTR
jgi:hypothetical protein